MSDIWDGVREYGPEAMSNWLIDTDPSRMAERSYIREWCHWMHVCQQLEDMGIDINKEDKLHSALLGWASALKEVTLHEFDID